MEEFAEVFANLIRGTVVEKDEVELARLRKLSPKEQLEIGFVLREAMLQEKLSPDLRQARLSGVRSVEDARRFLNCDESGEFLFPSVRLIKGLEPRAKRDPGPRTGRYRCSSWR